MKHTFLALAAMVALLTSCQKEEITNLPDAATTFNTAASSTNAGRADNANGNFSVSIKEVNNKPGFYKLSVQIAAVVADINNDGIAETVALSAETKIDAFLDVVLPDGIRKPIFGKEGVRIKHIRTNGGGSEYESDDFAASQPFDFELVEVNLNVHMVSQALTVGQKNQFLILPNGKSVLQAPQVETVKETGKWKSLDNVEFVKTLVVTIGNDPAQDVEKLVFIPDAIQVPTGDPKLPYKTVELPAVELGKTHFNITNGVARFSSEDKIQAIYGSLSWGGGTWSGSGSGTIYSLRKGGGCGTSAGGYNKLCKENRARLYSQAGS